MSTSDSPLHKLRAEASRIVTGLKAAERGETVANDPAGKIVAARATDAITFGVVMDDKIIKITMPWSKIRETSETALIEYIVAQMRGAPDTIQ